MWPEVLSPVLTILPRQLRAWHLARERPRAAACAFSVDETLCLLRG